MVESNENYKKELFDLIPSLSAIDGKDKAGEDVESTIYGGEEDEEEEAKKLEIMNKQTELLEKLKSKRRK